MTKVNRFHNLSSARHHHIAHFNHPALIIQSACCMVKAEMVTSDCHAFRQMDRGHLHEPWQ